MKFKEKTVGNCTHNAAGVYSTDQCQHKDNVTHNFDTNRFYFVLDPFVKMIISPGTGIGINNIQTYLSSY